MNNYGELQQLKGVGRLTAKALAAAGFTNLAKVAGAEPDELAEGLSTVNAPSRATGLIKQAKALVSGEAHPAPAEGPKPQEPPNGKAPPAPPESPEPQESTNGEATSWGWESTGLAQLLVKNIGPGLLKAPAFRTALIRRAIQHPPTRAQIIRKVVEDLG